MKTVSIAFAALLALGAQGAIAHTAFGEAQPDYPQRFTSGVERAGVAAEALMANAAGAIARGEASYVLPSKATVGKTRAEVLAETLTAQRLGLVAFGESPVREATPAELAQIQMAGARARAELVAQGQ